MSFDIVDASFMPDQTAVNAALADVQSPWLASTVITKHGRFTKFGVRQELPDPNTARR